MSGQGPRITKGPEVHAVIGLGVQYETETPKEGRPVFIMRDADLRSGPLNCRTIIWNRRKNIASAIPSKNVLRRQVKRIGHASDLRPGWLETAGRCWPSTDLRLRRGDDP